MGFFSYSSLNFTQMSCLRVTKATLKKCWSSSLFCSWKNTIGWHFFGPSTQHKNSFRLFKYFEFGFSRPQYFFEFMRRPAQLRYCWTIVCSRFCLFPRRSSSSLLQYIPMFIAFIRCFRVDTKGFVILSFFVNGNYNRTFFLGT